nr:hypothetical protein [Tanacetum cinerariifolium]
MELIMTIKCPKCRLWNVFLSNSKLVITRAQVDLCKHSILAVDQTNHRFLEADNGSPHSCIFYEASLYEDRATGAAPETKLIWNSTCRVGGSLGKSSGKTFEKSYTIAYLPSKAVRTISLRRLEH